jgi:transketolase
MAANALAAQRCRRYRRRILDISQQVPALHIGSAFSCTEIVDCICNGLVKPQDIFLMSKGHGCMIQYVILEEQGLLIPGDLAAYCTSRGRLGAHPDIETPGIVAATGSLGHGLGMAVGMALAERNSNVAVYVVVSDGELQEGSSWEAILMASSLGLENLVVVVDYNNLQSLGKTSDTHPSFYPLVDKFWAFGWEALEVPGHDWSAIYNAVAVRQIGGKPLAVVARTTKGKGVSFMEGIPLWHYRSPNKLEYERASAELKDAS